MRGRLYLLVAIVSLCVSYLTLGLADASRAAQLWWEYALATGLLGVAGLAIEWRDIDDQ